MQGIDRQQSEDSSGVTAAFAACPRDASSCRRHVRTTLLLIAAWVLVAGFGSDWYVDRLARDALADAEQKISQEAGDLIGRLESSLAIFQGIPAIISREEAVRRALLAAAGHGAREALNDSLAWAVRDLSLLGVLWVSNRRGERIAASNSGRPDSLVGGSDAGNDYFKAALAGHPGRQFTAGRETAAGSLFFSAPVYAGSSIAGIVVGKIDFPGLATWAHQSNVFITDAHGVVIQAGDESLRMAALPSAPVRQMSASERLERYHAETLREMVVVPWDDPLVPGLYRLDDRKTPLLMVSRATARRDFTITVLRPVPQLALHRSHRNELFALAAVVGAIVLSLVSSALYFIGKSQRERRRREHQVQIDYLSSHDALTGLFSRAVVGEMISHGIAVAARTGRRLAVVFMDLDMFKDINDSLGHESGDLVLLEVARRLRGTLRASDPVIRHGGDEFVILLNDLETTENAGHLTGKILETLRVPFLVGGVTLNLSASLGIALYPDDGDNASDLLRNADSALYRSKASGRSTFSFYHASMNADTKALLALEHELRKALERDEFVLHYQPQYSLSEHRVIGCEALLRWQHPTRGLLPPGEFIAATEKSGLVVALGEWVLREACRQAAAWREAGVIDFPIAVNLSAVQFRKPGLVDTIARTLADSRLPAAGLELELTETAVMENTEEAVRTVQALKALGVGLSIDDFGTGYSSLAYLKRFEPDVLKIDRSFVRDVETDANDLAIVNVIIGLARSLNYRVIAEGVETESQMARLQQLGLREIQGYWFSQPLTAERFVAFIGEKAVAGF